MRGKRLPMHFGHSPGAVGLSLTTDHSFLLTCGTDEAIRAHNISTGPNKEKGWWEENPNNAPDALEVPMSSVHEVPICDLSLTPEGRTLATASTDGFVRLFSVKVEGEGKDKRVEGELVQSCARFGGPVRVLAFSPTGAFLAAAGDEPGVIKVVTICSPGNVRVMRAEGPGGDMIVYICYDPRNDFIASIGKAGTAGVWSIETGKWVKSLEVGGRKVKSLAWAPNGMQLVLGTDDGAVIVGRDSWMFQHKLEDLGQDDDGNDDEIYNGIGLGVNREGEKLVTAVAWSSDGHHILTGTDAGAIVLWNAQSRTIVSTWRTEAGVQKLMWHPASNALIACDTLGQWGIIGPVVPPHMLSSNDEASKKEYTVDDLLKGFESEEDTEGAGPKVLHRTKSDEERKDGEFTSEEGDEVGSAAEANDEGEDIVLSEEASLGLGDIDADEEQVYPKQQSKDQPDSNRSPQDPHSRKRRKKPKSKLPNTNPSYASRLVAQSSFQPSSTPLIPNQRRRILCWNLIGVVTSHDEHVHNTISIEFADSSMRPVRIRDHYQYTMSSLTSAGVLLACSTAQDHPSHIYFRPFQSWSGNSDWTLILPENECVTGIVLSSRFAAVATSSNLIRILSMTGVQADVFSAPGRIITLAASGYSLSYVFSPSEQAPELLYSSVELNSWNELGKMLYSESYLPLSPSSSLTWFGYISETAALTSYDSSGTLRVRYGSKWVPMLTRVQEVCKCKVFWLAAVTESAAVGVSCLSNETYPSASSRPALRTVPFIAPVIVKSESPVSERLFRSRLKEWCLAAQREEEDSEEDEDLEQAKMEVEKCLLFMVEEACRAGKGTRALDFVSRLRSPVGFEQASRVANHYRMQALAERVAIVAKAKLAQIQAEEEEHYLAKYRKQAQITRATATRSISTPEEGVKPPEDSAPALSKEANVPEQEPTILDTVSDDDEEKASGGHGTQKSSQGVKRVIAPKEQPEPRSKRSKISQKRKVPTVLQSHPSTQVSTAGKGTQGIKKKTSVRRNPFARPTGSQATLTSKVK